MPFENNLQPKIVQKDSNKENIDPNRQIHNSIDGSIVRKKRKHHVENGTKKTKTGSSVSQKDPRSLVRFLDRLSFLIERNSKSCSAVGYTNGKFLVADNEISASTTDTHEVFRFIDNVFKYYSQYAAGYSDKPEKDRAELFESIFDKKFSGEKAGCFSPIAMYTGVSHFGIKS